MGKLDIGKFNVAVFSKGKEDWTHTNNWFLKTLFNPHNLYWVVSEGDDVLGYEEQTGARVVVAEGARNLAAKRQWAVDNLTYPRKPWLLTFEDNINRVTGVVPTHYNRARIEETTRAMYHATEYTPQEVIARMEKDIELAETLGVHFGGYASNDNHFFRKKKYRQVAFVWTKMCYMHRNGPKWPTYVEEKDDFAYTAECLKQDQVVLVNNYLYPWSTRYEGRGGSRTIEERAEDKRRAVQELHRRFPGMFHDKEKNGHPSGTEVKMRFTSQKQVVRWAYEMQQQESSR